jgi:hypothetical protein
MGRNLVVLAIAAAVALIPPDARARQNRHQNVSISTRGSEPITDCGQITLRADDLTVARAEQEGTIPLSSTPLEIRAVDRGGIHI